VRQSGAFLQNDLARFTLPNIELFPGLGRANRKTHRVECRVIWDLPGRLPGPTWKTPANHVSLALHEREEEQSVIKPFGQPATAGA
jgi:hypothetical protein